MASKRSDRLAAVNERVVDAERRLSRRRPDTADEVHRSFRRLHDGLDKAHRNHCDAVDEARWSAYVDDLDRGLSELETEMARAATDRLSIAESSEMLVVRTSALELSGWRLRFTFAQGQPGFDEFRKSLATAEATVTGHGRGSQGVPGRWADEVTTAVDNVRRAANHQSSSRSS